MVIFHCHVSFRGLVTPLILRSWRFDGICQLGPPVLSTVEGPGTPSQNKLNKSYIYPSMCKNFTGCFLIGYNMVIVGFILPRFHLELCMYPCLQSQTSGRTRNKFGNWVNFNNRNAIWNKARGYIHLDHFKSILFPYVKPTKVYPKDRNSHHQIIQPSHGHWWTITTHRPAELASSKSSKNLQTFREKKEFTSFGHTKATTSASDTSYKQRFFRFLDRKIPGSVSTSAPPVARRSGPVVHLRRSTGRWKPLDILRNLKGLLLEKENNVIFYNQMIRESWKCCV